MFLIAVLVFVMLGVLCAWSPDRGERRWALVFGALAIGTWLGSGKLHGGWLLLAEIAAVVVGIVGLLVAFAFAGRALTRDRVRRTRIHIPRARMRRR